MHNKVQIQYAENFVGIKIRRIFALANRKVAQLVAHYVRDVGVGRSSRLFPTNKAKTLVFALFHDFYLQYIFRNIPISINEQ